MRILYRHLLPIAMLALSATFSQAAELSSDAKSAIPKDVQQLIVVDYRAMQNSNAAMALKERVLPPELKRLESALKNAKLNVDKDADVLAFALSHVCISFSEMSRFHECSEFCPPPSS